MNVSPLNGWLILDKPAGITSAHAVAKVKRWLKPAKIGHAGTLDPLASGILPLALGEATKTVAYIMHDEKEYRFTVTWGEQRTTDDAEGEAMHLSDLRPSREAIESLLPGFIGKIMQAPPAFSAIKLDGKRAYAMAREGQAVVIPAREVTIESLDITAYDAQETSFHVTCGKGTYIRSLARDFGQRLGCYGYVSALRRTRVGKFSEKLAISLAECESLGHTPPPVKGLWSVESALDDILALYAADSHDALKLKTGIAVSLANLTPLNAVNQSEVIGILHGGILQALAKVEGEVAKPVRVFNH